jgi:chaperonin GroES
MRLINKKILFRPFKGNETTEGGLFVPESARKLSSKGEIVDIGERVTKVKKGDVAFRVKDWEGEAELIIDGEKHFIMDENAILALA